MTYKKSIIIVFICIFFLSIYYWGWLGNPAKNIIRYQPSVFSKLVTYSSNLSYDQYALSAKNAVTIARQNAHVNSTPKVIFENSPSQLLPDAKACPKNSKGQYDNGILLIHGLFDSPYGMQQLSTFFLNRCFVVNIILLPGHGTIPGDLVQVRYQDWIKATDFGIEKLAEKAKNIYLVGYSLGGLIAINEALDHPGAFKALILFAPVLKIKSSLAWLIAPLHSLSLYIPRLQWWEYKSDSSVVRYESIPINAPYQTKLLIDLVHDKLKSHFITLPIFVLYSDVDETVDARSGLDFFESSHHSASRMLWYSAHPEHFQDDRIQIVDSAVPAQKILDMSHLSFILPTSDPIYGVQGQYKDCLHYEEQSANWKQCELGKNVFLGETTSENLKLHIIQRLTFNPLVLLRSYEVKKGY